jgi:hypothetical protein
MDLWGEIALKEVALLPQLGLILPMEQTWLMLWLNVRIEAFVIDQQVTEKYLISFPLLR